MSLTYTNAYSKRDKQKPWLSTAGSRVLRMRTETLCCAHSFQGTEVSKCFFDLNKVLRFLYKFRQEKLQHPVVSYSLVYWWNKWPDSCHLSVTSDYLSGEKQWDFEGFLGLDIFEMTFHKKDPCQVINQYLSIDFMGRYAIIVALKSMWTHCGSQTFVDHVEQQLWGTHIIHPVE